MKKVFIIFSALTILLCFPFSSKAAGTCYCVGERFVCVARDGSDCKKPSYGQGTTERCIAPDQKFFAPPKDFKPFPPLKLDPNDKTDKGPITEGKAYLLDAKSPDDCAKLPGYLNEYANRVNHLGGWDKLVYSGCVYTDIQAGNLNCEKAKELLTKPPEDPTETLNKKFDFKAPILEILIPNLTFTDVKTTVDDKGNIEIPWIGEYLAAVYRLVVSFASIVAVIMVIREGIRILLSAGGDGKIQGYKNIGRIAAGLFLAWGSYIILYNVNSDLTSFRALRIQISDIRAQTQDEADQIDERQYDTYKKEAPDALKDVTVPTWNRQTFDCNKKDSYPEMGVRPEGQLIPYNCGGKIATIKTVPEMQKPLCDVVDRVEAKGYKLIIGEAYRPFKDQVALWCGQRGKCFKKYPNVNDRANFCATPGFSKHGLGRAVDVNLMKNGKIISFDGSKGQCNKPKSDFEELANFFFYDDAGNPTGFERLETEGWHFEYKSDVKDGTRGLFKGYPKACGR